MEASATFIVSPPVLTMLASVVVTRGLILVSFLVEKLVLHTIPGILMAPLPMFLVMASFNELVVKSVYNPLYSARLLRVDMHRTIRFVIFLERPL